MRSWCENSQYSRPVEAKTKKKTKRSKAFWEIRDARLRSRVSTTVYVNKRTSWSSGGIGLTRCSERQMTPITHVRGEDGLTVLTDNRTCKQLPAGSNWRRTTHQKTGGNTWVDRTVTYLCFRFRSANKFNLKTVFSEFDHESKTCVYYSMIESDHMKTQK